MQFRLVNESYALFTCKPCYEEYDVEYGKCLEMLGNLTYSEDVGARAAIEWYIVGDIGPFDWPQ